MGIAGLLPQLRSITKRVHVSKYRGQTMAVDAYCLLHRGSYGCARELVEGEPTDRHVHYCMGRIELLTRAGVRPLVVFDGGRLPAKQDEERARERSREENKARARTLWAQGNRAAAMECYQRAVDIQPAHAKQFLEALKQRNIPYIVAPYEADAQMAYLALNGLVDAVLTEDSDLLCYGCPRVLFKLDKGGEGEEVALADLPAAKELALQGFGHELFQEMCVLAGCDFVDSLQGIGIKKAHQHLRRTRCFLKVVRSLRFDGTKIPEGYEARVQRALWTFKHQRVYCPRRGAVVHLTEVAGGNLAAGARVQAAAQLGDGEPDFLGPPLPDDVAQAIAVGDLDPITKQPFAEELQPCTAPLAADGAASGCGGGPASLRHAPGEGQQRGSGRGRSSKAAAGAAANGGNTLANYFRGLPKPAAVADFRPPRANGAQPGSQDSLQDPQQQQQQQQEEVEGEVTSPRSRVGQPAGENELASPTEEQWARFRQRRQKGSGRAPSVVAAPAAAAAAAAAAAGAAGLPRKPAGPTTSSYFSQPAALGMQRPAGAARGGGGGLLAKLKMAVHQEEPSIDELLSRQRAQSLPAAAASSDLEGDGPEEDQEEAPLRLGGRRRRFVVPVSEPSIDDLLGRRLGGRKQESEGEEEAQLPSLACSPAASQQPQLSQRAWLPRRVTQPPQALQQEKEQSLLLDLISPGGPAFLQQQQQQDEGGGITPGFYCGGSEAGSDAGRLTSALPRRPPGVTPSSNLPPSSGQHRQQQQQQPAVGGVADLHPTFDDAARQGRGAGMGEASPSPCGDPIASLTHVAAFQGEAEAAVDRAAQAALQATALKTLRKLPTPGHQQQQRGPAAAAAAAAAAAEAAEASSGAAKRVLLGLKENKPSGRRRKRTKSGCTSAATDINNPFAGFQLSG